MMKQMWCEGCKEVKGELPEDFIKMTSSTLGCCPKCGTQWMFRDKK